MLYWVVEKLLKYFLFVTSFCHLLVTFFRNYIMNDRNKLVGMPYMINVIELLIEKFLNYDDKELNRKNLASLLSILKRFEKNVKQKQLSKGYIKRKTYISKDEKKDQYNGKSFSRTKKRYHFD